MKKYPIAAAIALLLASVLFSQDKPPQPKVPPKPKATTQPQASPPRKAAAQSQTPKAPATVKELKGKVEIKARRDAQPTMVPLDQILPHVREAVARL